MLSPILIFLICIIIILLMVLLCCVSLICQINIIIKCVSNITIMKE